MVENGYAKPVLVTTEWLAANLGAEGLVVVEADEHPGLYPEGHIPGAVDLHWRRDLQDPVKRDVVDREALQRLLGRRGIGNDTTLVLYGDKNNWLAAYAYWSLKLYRHEDVRILDGGRQKWIDEDRELTTVFPSRPRREYAARDRDESIRARRDDVLAGLRARSRVLVDVRSTAEYAGEVIAPPGYEQEGSQRPGHIPTAVSIPWATAVRDDGSFRPAPELRALYEGKGVAPDRPVTVYCRIGERCAHTWFVLRELLGYAEVRSYDGSWTEWGSLVDAPIELGRAA